MLQLVKLGWGCIPVGRVVNPVTTEWTLHIVLRLSSLALGGRSRQAWIECGESFGFVLMGC
jgi:hypothetical protein